MAEGAQAQDGQMGPGRTVKTIFMALEAKCSFGSDPPVSLESSHRQYTSKQVCLWPVQPCLEKERAKETRKSLKTGSVSPDKDYETVQEGKDSPQELC